MNSRSRAYRFGSRLFVCLVAAVLAIALSACSTAGFVEAPVDEGTNQIGSGVLEPVSEMAEADVSDVPAETGAGMDAAQPEVAEEVAQPTEAQSAQQGTAQSDLFWRDADFALDPVRTDWSFADNGRKVVYLTIDDGPSPRTPEVLDILDRYGAKATFFVVGADPDSYHYIKEAYDRGHTIGLHTFSHDYASVYSSPDAYYADLAQIAQVVKDQIGYVPCFIRFPGGSSNGVSANYCPGIMTSLVESVQAQGYQYYDWNVSTGDGAEHTADELVGYVKEFTPEENIVLLCHDSAGKQTTVEALPRIIEYYQGMGYTFEAIDRSTWVPHHGVSN